MFIRKREGEKVEEYFGVVYLCIRNDVARKALSRASDKSSRVERLAYDRRGSRGKMTRRLS